MIRRDIADYLHARRIAATLPGTVVAREDGQFLVHLIATAALGDAIYGAQFRRSAGSRRAPRPTAGFAPGSQH